MHMKTILLTTLLSALVLSIAGCETDEVATTTTTTEQTRVHTPIVSGTTSTTTETTRD